MTAVFDRELNEVRIQQPLNTGVVGHFYTMEDAEGRKRYELEQWLSEYEDKASSVIAKLAAGQAIEPEERSDMAVFVALAAFRTPDIIDSIKALNADLIENNIKRIYTNVNDVKDMIRSKPGAPATEDELEAEAAALVEFAQGGHYTIKTNHKWAISTAIRTAVSVAPIFAERAWVVFHRDNDKKSFITTDAPVVLISMTPNRNSFWGIGYGSADALVLFPLSESCILAMHGNEKSLGHLAADTKQVRRFNLAVADHCQRFVIGRDEALVRSLANRLNLANRQWEPKMQRT